MIVVNCDTAETILVNSTPLNANLLHGFFGKFARALHISQSSFNTPSGILALYSVDGQVSTTTRFYLKNNVLQVDLNGVYSGPLTLAQVSVTNLTFNRLVSTSSEAVKIDMTLKYVYGSITRQKNYQTTVVLKGV